MIATIQVCAAESNIDAVPYSSGALFKRATTVTSLEKKIGV
jgi:hypothetical protein